MRLAELQRAFQAHILSGTAGIEAIVPGSERFDVATRLSVYSAGYAERLIEALAQTYPAVKFALGERTYARLVRQLAQTSPSRHYSVRYYGAELAALIARELAGPRGRGGRELALWEWDLAAAFDAADTPTVSAADLAAIEPEAWPALRFMIAPSLHVRTLQTNAVQWWKAACAEGPRPQRWRARRPAEWVLWRAELAIYFRELEPAEARALAAARRGATFEAMCAELEGDAAAAARAATLLHGWLKAGWIVGVRRP